MGLGSFIGKAFKAIAPTAAATIMGGPAAGFISGAGSLLDMATPTLMDLGGQAIANKYITKPNSQMAYQQSEAASAKAFERNQIMAKDAFERSYGAYKNRYRDTMADMKAAGLNPILAASGGFNVGTSPNAPALATSSAQGFQPHQPTLLPSASAKSVSEKQVNISRLKQIAADTKKSLNQANESLSNINLNNARTREAVQRARNLLAEHAKIVQQALSANLNREKLDMLMRTLRGIENDLKEPLKFLDYLQSGKPGISVNNYVQETKKLFRNIYESGKEKLQRSWGN